MFERQPRISAADFAPPQTCNPTELARLGRGWNWLLGNWLDVFNFSVVPERREQWQETHGQLAESIRETNSLVRFFQNIVVRRVQCNRCFRT